MNTAVTYHKVAPQIQIKNPVDKYLKEFVSFLHKEISDVIEILSENQNFCNVSDILCFFRLALLSLESAKVNLIPFSFGESCLKSVVNP